MKIDKLIAGFKSRLEDVFNDDLREINWELRLADKFEDSGKNLKETFFIFNDKEEKQELMLTVNHSLSIPLLKLSRKKESGNEEIIGNNLEMAVMSRDTGKLEESNENVFKHLEELEASVFKRIYRYISLKIGEFIY